MAYSVGLDFGTTNSVLGVADENGASRLISFRTDDLVTDTFRSILFFDEFERDEHLEPVRYAGPAAITAYWTPGMSGRLIQSMKTHLASRSFRETRIFGARYTLEELLAGMLKQMRLRAEEEIGEISGGVVIGRPVHFRGEKTEKDGQRAAQRLRYAAEMAGFRDFELAFEPLGAAYHYAADLEREELVLIGDFGGGTSDFCLLRVGPGFSQRRQVGDAVLGVGGIGIGGDSFDARIVEHAVADQLGRGSSFRNVFGKVLPVPAQLYANLENWHQLSFMDTPRIHRMIDEVVKGSEDPAPYLALQKLLRERLGFRMYEQVEALKVRLSSAEAASLQFDATGIDIDIEITRDQFEGWILQDVIEIGYCVAELLDRTGTHSRDVDRVFLTGGSSHIPVLVSVFEEIFGAEKVVSGDALTSVASGLAIIAQDRRGVAEAAQDD